MFTIMEDFRIKEVLKAKGMTAATLAKKIGITPAALSQSLSNNPTFDRLKEIANALGVDLPELFASSKNIVRCPHCGAVLELKEK